MGLDNLIDEETNGEILSINEIYEKAKNINENDRVWLGHTNQREYKNPHVVESINTFKWVNDFGGFIEVSIILRSTENVNRNAIKISGVEGAVDCRLRYSDESEYRITRFDPIENTGISKMIFDEK